MENMFDTYDLPRTRRFSSEIVQLDAPRRNIPGARIKRKSLHARLRVLAQKARNVAGDVSIGQYDVQAQCVVRQWYVSGSMQISTRLSHSPYDVDVVIDLPEGQRVFCEVKAAPNPIPEDLGARINQLMKDRQLRERFGKAGRKRAEEKFSWTAIAAKTKALYESLNG